MRVARRVCLTKHSSSRKASLDQRSVSLLRYVSERPFNVDSAAPFESCLPRGLGSASGVGNPQVFGVNANCVFHAHDSDSNLLVDVVGLALGILNTTSIRA